MTPRDRDIFHFIEMVGICTAQQIRDVFMPNVDISKTYQRLRILENKGYIKINKIGLNNYYYIGKKTSIKMLEHDLKTTELICYLKANGANIIDFKRNMIIGKTLEKLIYADGYVSYKVKIGEKTYKRHILIEVQKSIQYKINPAYGYLYGCLEKYNHDSIKEGIDNIASENGFKQVPPLVVITNIKDDTSRLYHTKLIKLPFIKNEKWDILIR